MKKAPKKILIIQTAFLGDVILATALIESLKKEFPDSQIDFLVRKGNETVLKQHPNLRHILVWDKSQHKIKHLFNLIRQVRSLKYDLIVNCHRYWSSGLICAFSGAKYVSGFNKNPLSFVFHNKVPHQFNNIHETERNHALLAPFVNNPPSKPKIYPEAIGVQFIPDDQKFVTISPASVWFTKQLPATQWIELINALPEQVQVVLLGGPNDKPLCDSIKKGVKKPDTICNLAGRLQPLQSAFVMQQAVLNYVNDSAPLHLCSATDAPVCAVYCSTTPVFGFGPLSTTRFVIESEKALACKPCGIHGHATCPLQHFDCAESIKTEQLIAPLLQILETRSIQ